MDVMKKTVSFILLTALAVSCLCGCGGEFTDGTGKSGGAVSGGAVSGGAVSGGAVKEEAVEADHTGRILCNGNCRYFEFDEEIITQVSLKDGKKKTCKVPGMFDLFYVGEDELIYWGDTDKPDVEAFYTVPIVSRADGTEELKPDEAKQIPGVPNGLDYIGATYADEQYIIYCREGEAEVRCYNRKTGQTSEMPMKGKIKQMVAEDIDDTKRIGESLYLHTMGGGILCWQMDENKVYFYAGDEWIPDVQTYTKDGVFCIDNNQPSQNVVMLDLVSQKKTKIILKDEVDRLLKQELGDVRYWGMEDLFLDGGRVYVQADVEWVENKICYAHSVVFSREIDGSGELKYEKKLTEELMAAIHRADGRKEESLNKVEDELGTDDTSGIEMVWNYSGYCMIADGKAYMFAEEKEGAVACYDLKSGACKAVKRGDPEYYAMGIF